MVKEDITLSDGSVLPAGFHVFVAGRYLDPAVYANPGDFDPYRFLRAREQPDQVNSWQHVTMSPLHMGFGYGQHACPGRFFASNEMKIAITHLLLQYDWEAVEGDTPFWEYETSTLAKPMCKARLRRRREEIKLDMAE